MVDDMDEAAVYGSPMYHLLEEVFSIGGPGSGGSDSSDSGQEDASPATDETKPAAQPPIAAEGTDGGEAGSTVDFDRAWELFGRGEMDARTVLGVLARIHGEDMGDRWPLVRAALPPGHVSSSLYGTTSACMKYRPTHQTSSRIPTALDTQCFTFADIRGDFPRSFVVPPSGVLSSYDRQLCLDYYVPAPSGPSLRRGKTRRGEGKSGGSRGHSERGCQGGKKSHYGKRKRKPSIVDGEIHSG